MKLNQVIAIEKGAKNRINDEITKTYHACQKVEMLGGLTRTYQPKEEGGEQFPPEKKLVQASGVQMLKDTARLMTELFDLTLLKDDANRIASANIVVDGIVLLKEVPVTHLLFLEHQLTDLRTILNKIPVLDPAETWAWNGNVNAYATEPTSTVKTKKIPRAFVKAEATDKHPAQVDVYHEDVVAGTWTLIKYSGALPAADKALLLNRVEKLLMATKAAREEANEVMVKQDRKEGEVIFNHLFAGLIPTG